MELLFHVKMVLKRLFSLIISLQNLHMCKIKLYQWSSHPGSNGEPIAYRAIALSVVLWEQIIISLTDR